MDFQPSETQEDVAQVARKVFAAEATPEARWRALAETGLTGLTDLLPACTLLEEQGLRTAPAPLWQALAAALVIDRFGTPAQRERWLAPLAAGDALLVAALADPERETLTVERAGDDHLLTGERLAVPAAADRVLLGAGDVVGVIDPRAEGVTLEPQVLTTGETAHRMTLQRVRLPAANVLGGRAVLDFAHSRAGVLLSALQLGVAERALQMTAAYTTTRRQFDRPIATFQAVAQRAADAYIDVEAMRLTLWRAAFLLSEGRDDEARAAVAIARYWAAEAGHRVVYAAQHLHGGIGFDVSYPLHSCTLWSRHLELALGPASSHLARLGAELSRS